MNENKRKTIGTIFGIIMFIGCILFITYAWYVWHSEYVNVNANIVETNGVNFTPDTLEVNATDIGPILNYSDDSYYTEANKGKYLAYADFVATNNADVSYEITAILNIVSITDILKDDSFQYLLLKKDTIDGDYDEEVSSGDFSNFSIGDNSIISNEVIPGNSTYYYRFIAYINGNIYNSNTIMNGSLRSFLKLSSSEYVQDVMLLSEGDLGSYVSMTPTSSSYTTDKSKTGYTSTQTINPQELDLWRIINVNDDGTVDMISEYVSSVDVYFSGQTGYQNLVGYLNVLASQYENSTYTTGSRYFGYNGQTEYITDTSKFTNSPPWICSTGESCNPIESQGGGDNLYTNDYNLVNTILGTLEATDTSGTVTSYWIASRKYEFLSSQYQAYEWAGRIIENNGLDFIRLYDAYMTQLQSSSVDNALRPILTLQSTVYITSGSGTSDEPYVIANDDTD